MQRDQELGSGRLARAGRWRREHARRVIAAWKKSGATLAEFAQAQKIGAERLRYWRDQLALEARHLSRGRKPASAEGRRPVSLVPVVMRGAAPALPSGFGGKAGHVTSVPMALAGIDPVWLARLLQALVVAEVQR
jgi:hypothetical protein